MARRPDKAFSHYYATSGHYIIIIIIRPISGIIITYYIISIPSSLLRAAMAFVINIISDGILRDTYYYYCMPIIVDRILNLHDHYQRHVTTGTDY